VDAGNLFRIRINLIVDNSSRILISLAQNILIIIKKPNPLLKITKLNEDRAPNRIRLVSTLQSPYNTNN
jgi:hypothetical protein